MRLIYVDLAQYIANTELSSDSAGIVQWVLSHTPSVDAEPVRHVRWLYINGREYLGSHCSNCQKWYDYKY